MLSEIDKKILCSLDDDSAKSLTRISEEIGISPQLVKYHIERLEEGGIILAFWPMIEFRKLGYSNASYFLKLKNLSEKAERDIHAYLKRQNHIIIVMRGDGYWDLHLTISTKNIFRSVEVFNRFYDKFHHYILSYDTAISVGFYQFRRKYLKVSNEKIKDAPLALTGADVEIVKLSNDQLRIIEIVNKNCRQSVSDIAKALNLSRDKVLYNFKKIRKEGIIQSNTYLIDNEKVEHPRYRILLQTTDFTSKEFENFFNFCKDDRNIINFLRLFGNWQVLIDVEIDSREKLRDLLKRIMNKYGNLIIRIENTHVYKVDKFRDIPFKLEN